jgi:F-type H+-transporting ATPase subunit epsilon
MVFSGEVEQVDVPGVEGDFGVLAHHAPLIAMIKPGILTVFGGGETKRIVVVGGFAEVNDQGLTVLADMAVPVEDFDRASLGTQIKDAEEDAADATDDAERDAAREKLEQLKALQDSLAH